MTELSEAKARTHDFYRCYKCGKLITALEEHLFLTGRRGKQHSYCSCGSMTYCPTNPPGPFKRIIWNGWVWPWISPLFLVPNPYVFIQGWLRIVKILTKGRRGF